ncbi:AAA family ATPase [[Clostridium] aminophilum]|uniref:Cytidylate kinase n=1 Tax=[Clostridium] aminophilum TaxID=1526 RepID=A0A1I0DIH3_9FIRM|nr:cytidylate kinase-like family protein [[Clostridium] aminophilum]MCR4629913.1 cytidylate kinase-like family protein [Clostridium sp.]MDD6197004.1 cytidylate kinase-like family protein [[Clostridium] aminophilum]SET31910.1 Cytidylate kinase [[Clostridium] aminophilum]SFR64268.1 Cytidylate kinase [[Clostridium] aminophilum]
MANSNLIITIEREYGSGGRIVGKKLAEQLGAGFYDDDLIRIASEKSAVGEQYFRMADEKAGKNIFSRFSGHRIDLTEPSPDSNLTSPENLFRFQAQVMRELAEQGPCVFVGRASGFILDQFEEIEHLVRVFVLSDIVTSVQRVVEVDMVDEERAKKRIRQISRERKEYYRYFTDSDWYDMKNYDLTVNTTRFDLDQTVELIKNYIRLKGYIE